MPVLTSRATASASPRARRHAVAVALDAPERDRVQVAADADRRANAPDARGASSSAPTSADVTRSPFITSSGVGRAAPAAGPARRPCRAARPRAGSRSGAERGDRRRSASSITLGQVVHRERRCGSIPKPTRCSTIRSRIGRPATRSIGLGTVSVSGRRRDAPAAGHDDRPVGALDPGSRNSCSRCSADGAAVGVDDRDRRDPSGAHELERVGAVRPGVDRDELARDDGRDGVVERPTAEQRPADVAVGRDADQPAVIVDRERDPAGRPVERRHRVADRPVDGNEARLEAARSSWGRARGASAPTIARAGFPTTVRPGSTSPTTTAPIPTVAPVADGRCGRAPRRPSPMNAFAPDRSRHHRPARPARCSRSHR